MPYNGYTNWTRWNIALWLYNDEGLNNIMLDAMAHNRSIHEAADTLMQSLHDLGITCTPDGAKFTRTGLVEVLRNWQ